MAIYTSAVLGLILIGLACLILLAVRQRDNSEARETRLRISALEGTADRIERSITDQFRQTRESSEAAARADREELSSGLTQSSAALVGRFDVLTEKISGELGATRGLLESTLTRTAADLLAKQDRMREEASANNTAHRREISESLKQFNDSFIKALAGAGAVQKLNLDSMSAQIQGLTSATEARLESFRSLVESKLAMLQETNVQKLDEMRQTVDEKLQSTLEKRLGESFKQVSERLELVHQGLGEMQTLANGVGDLKRVLTNVTSRGGWGEVQLEALLEDFLTSEQYARNVNVKVGTSERVEFAVKLPGRAPESEETVWLPVDSKFPMEDYDRLRQAQEAADTAAVDEAGRSLERTVKACARDISSKYLNPPSTTDFAIMFLPTEGLFAEAVRRPGLLDCLQREFRVLVAGPTTLTAILSALQMGFRTLTIQKRSAEVWRVLGAVKTEFSSFGDAIAGVRTKLDQAISGLEKVGTRSRALNRQLRDVEALPMQEAQSLIESELDAPPTTSPVVPDDDSGRSVGSTQ
jgi:DNA recombination protein RmuC